MSRIDLLKEFEETLNNNLLSYSEDYLMNKPKDNFLKEWKETKEKLCVLKELINQEQEEQKEVFYMVKDEKNGLLKRFFMLNQATTFAEKKKKEYMGNYDRTNVWVEVNGSSEKIYEAKGYAKQENEETEELE